MQKRSLIRSFVLSLCLVAIVAPGCGDDDGTGAGGGAGGGTGTGGGTGGSGGDGGTVDTDGGLLTDGGAGGGLTDSGVVLPPLECLDPTCVGGCDATLASCTAFPNSCDELPADGDCGAWCGQFFACETDAGDCLADCIAGTGSGMCTGTCFGYDICVGLSDACVTNCETRKTDCAACEADHTSCVAACPIVACDGGV